MILVAISPWGIVQRNLGNFDRGIVKLASSCASSKNDDRRTAVVNDSGSEVRDDISQDYDEDDGSPQ